MTPVEERCIALAGVFQAATEVRRIGRDGNAGSASMDVILRSLFTFEVATVLAVYGSLEELSTGFASLRRFLRQERDRASLEVARYTNALIGLESKLSVDPTALADIHAGLSALVEEKLDSPPYDEHTISRIAQIYLRHVSPAGPRIMVQGEPAYLNASGNPERIRALLLGGLRSAVLWRQMGGGRLKLIFERRALLAASEEFLRAGTPPPPR